MTVTVNVCSYDSRDDKMGSLAPLSLKVLRRLSRAERDLELYTLYRSVPLTPAALANLLTSLRRRGLLIVQDERVRITDKGRDFIVQNRPFGDHRRREEICPESLRQPRLSPNEPYVPLLSRLDKDFF